MRLTFLFVLGALIMPGCSSLPANSVNEASSNPIRVIGHRGAAAYAPENTLASFDEAYALGVYEVELDIQLSKDGKIVLFHDDVLEKKTNLKGRVRDHDWERLKTAEIGTWFDRERGVRDRKFKGTRLNLLADLFEKYDKKFFYHVEIKTDDDRLPPTLVPFLEERGLTGHFLVTSFYKDQLVRMHTVDPSIPLCYLIDDEKREKDVSAAIRQAKELGFRQVAIRAGAIMPEHVALARELGLRIRGWGVKSPDDMNKILAAGAEGMTIDWPDWLIRKVLSSTPATL